MQYCRINISVHKYSTIFICLHWVLFGLLLCQETDHESAVKKNKEENLISSSDQTLMPTMTINELSNTSSATHLTSPETDNDHSILSAAEEIAIILLSPQLANLSESHSSTSFHIKNTNTSRIQTLHIYRPSSSSKILSSSLMQEQHSLIPSISLFVQSSVKNPAIDLSENNSLIISSSKKTTKTLDSHIVLPDDQTSSIASSTPSIVDSSLFEISSNFVFSFSSVKRENSVSSSRIVFSANLNVISTAIIESFDFQHNQYIPNSETTILASNTQLTSSCATELMTHGSENVSKGINTEEHNEFLADASCIANQGMIKRQNKNNAFDYSSISQPVEHEYKHSSVKPVQFLKDETVTLSSTATSHWASLKTEILSPSPIDSAISLILAEDLSEKNQKTPLQASFLETNTYSSERLIEVTPSLVAHRSSKEVIFKSVTVQDDGENSDNVDDKFSSEIISQTASTLPYTILNITNTEDHQNISALLREYDIESKEKNKTSRNDSPHLDDIISGILHLIAGDVKMIHPPANFHIPYSSLPLFRPTKPTSTRINNRGPPSFISPSRTVVLFSQPDHPINLVPRPVHPPTPWNVRPTNIHGPPTLRPVTETNLLNFHARPNSPTRPQNIHTLSTSVVHLYKPIFNLHSNPKQPGDLPFNGDMFVSVAKPSKDKQQGTDNANISPGVRLQQGVGTFEVFRPPINDKHMKVPVQNSRPSSLLTKASLTTNPNLRPQLSTNLVSSGKQVLETTTDWAPLLEHPTKKHRPDGESDGDRFPDDHDVVIITQPTIFDLTVTNSIAGLKKANSILQSSSSSEEKSREITSSSTTNVSKPSNSNAELTTKTRSEIETDLLSLSSLFENNRMHNRTNTKPSIISSKESTKSTVLSSFSTPYNFPSFSSTPFLQDSFKSSPSLIQSKYQTTRKYSTKLTSNIIDSSLKSFKSPYGSFTSSLRIHKSSVLTPSFELKSPSRINSVTRYSMTSSKANDRFNDRTLLGRPIVVPVDIEEVRPYVGAINPPPRQGPIPTSHNFPQGRPSSNESHVQIAQAGINVNDNGRGSLSNLPTVKPPQVRIPTQRLRPNSPLVRIDSCIVGDETTCNGKLNETCKSQLGISSCQCRAGFARMFIRGPCQPVVSLMLSVKLDRFENQKISFSPRYSDPNTEEYKLMEFEAKQALSSLFTYTVFGRHFLGVSVNKFYGIGNHLIANATIHLEENRLTRAPSMRLRIRQEVLQAIKQKNNNIGDSRLYAEGPLNPVPAVEDVNECADPNMNDCALDAICQNIFGTFQCVCRAGFIDSSPFDERTSGRRCSACSPDYCNNHGACYVEKGDKLCRCSGNYIGARCDIDSEVLGVAVGASIAAIIIILLTLACLCVWNRRWKREQQRTEVMSARSANSNQTFSYLNKLAKANTYRLTVEDRMRWAHISDVVSNLYAKPDVAGSNQNIGMGQNGYPDLIRCQSPTDDSLSWYNCGTRPRPRTVPYAQNQTAASFYDMNYPSQEMFMVPSHTAPRRNLNQNIQRTYYS